MWRHFSFYRFETVEGRSVIWFDANSNLSSPLQSKTEGGIDFS
jgi:hypothetical protein